MIQYFSGNTMIPSTPDFPPEQDRTLDPNTAAWWCVGCPYKAIKMQPRAATQAVNGETNQVPFDEVGQANAVYQLKTTLYCTSPKANFKQYLGQRTSTIGFGFCPFLQQKLDLIPDGNNDGD
jgi:hypothetical protein